MFNKLLTSLRFQLCAIVFIVAIPATGIIIHSGFQLREDAINEAGRDMQKLVERIAAEQQNLSAGAEQLMTVLAQLPEVKNHETGKVHTILADLIKLNPQYSNIFLIETNGSVWVTAKPAKVPFIVSDRRYFRNAMASGQLSSGEYVVSRATAYPTLNLAKPYRNENGEIIGVVAVGFNFEHYREMLAHINFPDTNFILVDHKGTVVFRPIEPEKLVGKSIGPVLLKNMLDAPVENSSIDIGADKIKRITSHRKLILGTERTPYMYVRVGIPYDVVKVKVYKDLVMDLAILVLSLFVALAVAWLVGKRSIVNRISLLKDASASMAAGNYQIKVSELVKGGELGELGCTFDNLAQQLVLREQSLRGSEQHYRSLFENSLFGIAVTDRNYFFSEVNQAFCDLLEYDPDELVGKMKISDVSHPEDAATSLQMINRLSNHEMEHYNLEKRYITKSGKVIDVLLYVRGTYNDNGDYIGSTASISDITEIKRNEELRRSDLALIESLLHNSPAGIRVFDAESGQCILVNNSAAQIAGGSKEALLDQNFRLLESWKATGLTALAEQVIADGIPRSLETTLHTSFDKEVPVTYQLSQFIVHGRLNLLVIGRDISEEKRLAAEKAHIETQMLHAQKLESMGVLAGGIAHDFNNLLTAIIGNADLALMRLSPESIVVDNLRRIEQAAERASDLARQMLAYSGRGRFVIEKIDVNRLVEEMLHMLEVSISKKAILRFNLHRPLPAIEADATQLRQIIMNLVINASEAIGDKSGVIAISSGCMECDRNYLKDVWLDENLTDGLYVYLEVSDTGCGMDKETLTKIFDPFFTTKFTGRGLGMAAVLGIVRGHKGAIKVYSEPGKGTTFKILLPASSKPEEIFNVATSDDWKGTGTVLLVDDEETIRAIGSEMLRELGFKVFTAEDGRHAMEIFREHKEINLVILDLTMPHMDGEQTFRELRSIKPDVVVIMSSGYNEQEVTQKFVGKGLAGFIQKPYKLSTMKEVISKAIS